MIKDSDRATRLPLWGLAYLNPPDPLFKGAIRACGLSIAAMAFPARQLRPGI